MKANSLETFLCIACKWWLYFIIFAVELCKKIALNIKIATRDS